MNAFFVGVEAWLAGMGPWAVLLALALMVIVAILPVPAEAPAMINGMLFGPMLGVGVTYVGAVAGAAISFELARRLGRPVATRFVSDQGIARVDGVMAKMGWGGLLIARLVPVVAFTALNWGAGLTNVPRKRFLWTTAVGIAPGAVLFVAFGSAVPKLFQQQPLLTTIGTLAVLGVIAYLAVRRQGEPQEAGDEYS